MRLYIQHGAKLIVNQLGCLYRHFGANSDGAACFLIYTSLISQVSSMRITLVDFSLLVAPYMPFH
jgi:hypothetical protein